MKKVGIIMGSDSDLPIVSKAADTLRHNYSQSLRIIGFIQILRQRIRFFGFGQRNKG